MKIIVSSDDNLPLKKTLEFQNVLIAVRSAFHESNKYYLKIFFDGCL